MSTILKTVKMEISDSCTATVLTILTCFLKDYFVCQHLIIGIVFIHQKQHLISLQQDYVYCDIGVMLTNLINTCSPSEKLVIIFLFVVKGI